MYPDNQQPENTTQTQQPLSATAPESAPINYLDQIAAPQLVKPSIFKNKLTIAIIVLVFTLIIVLGMSAMPQKAKPSETIAARLIATKTIADDATSKIKSTKLRSMNSNLKIYLTNTTRDLTPFLTSSKINIKKLDPKILAKESTGELTERLLDAKLNGVYDRTYAREMAYMLSTILTAYDSAEKAANRADYKTFLTDAKNNLRPTQEQFANYNADNG